MKRAIRIGVAVGLAILALAVWLMINMMSVRGADAHVRNYAQYTEVVKQLEQAELTVTDNGRVLGVYDLEQLGLMESALASADQRYGTLGKLSPEAYTDLPFWKRWKAYREAQMGVVMPDAEALDAGAVAEDLLAAKGELGDIDWEAVGAELDEEILSGALRQAVSDWTATEKAMESRSLNVAEFAIYRLPGEAAPLLYSELLSRAMEGLTIPVKIMDKTMELEIKSVVSVDKKGTGTIDVQGLEQLIDQWAKESPGGWLPYKLESYGRGTVELDFLHVEYELDQELLLTQLKDQISRLDETPVEAAYACTRNGEPYSIGDSYIEVDIARQKMLYYENGEMLLCTDVVTGFPNGHWTWPGLYQVQDKDRERQLIAWDYNIHVEYWLGYDGDYGIHDAAWRDDFGGDLYLDEGSHGCVNTPMEAMAAFFEKAEVGTPVIVHYVKE